MDDLKSFLDGSGTIEDSGLDFSDALALAFVLLDFLWRHLSEHISFSLSLIHI